jgi:transcriptional regulator with XRE-family HTH domain
MPKMIETSSQAESAVAEIKQRTGWTDAEIARRVGVNKSTIHRIRTGKMVFPDYSTRLALASTLIYARGIKQP